MDGLFAENRKVRYEFLAMTLALCDGLVTLGGVVGKDRPSPWSW